MTIEEKLTRCAALSEKIGRGPVWCEGERVRVRLRWKHDKRVAWWIKERYDSGRWRHYELMAGKPHDIDCILQVWLEDVELPKKDVFIHRFEGYYLPVIEVYSSEDDDWPLHKDGEFKEADPDEGTEAWAYTGCKFTALIEAAEKVLVAA